jgi:hypothetical protein
VSEGIRWSTPEEGARIKYVYDTIFDVVKRLQSAEGLGSDVVVSGIVAVLADCVLCQPDISAALKSAVSGLYLGVTRGADDWEAELRETLDEPPSTPPMPSGSN